MEVGEIGADVGSSAKACDSLRGTGKAMRFSVDMDSEGW